MQNQEKENELYTAIGQYIIESLNYNSIDKWNKAIITVKSSGDGITDIILDSELNGDLKNLRPLSAADSSVNLYNVIDELREYTNTNTNKYTRWNKFVFELTSSHKFEIEFSWDQNFHDDRE